MALVFTEDLKHRLDAKVPGRTILAYVVVAVITIVLYTGLNSIYRDHKRVSYLWRAYMEQAIEQVQPPRHTD